MFDSTNPLRFISLGSRQLTSAHCPQDDKGGDPDGDERLQQRLVAMLGDGTLSFLKELQQTKIRRLKFRQLLLLLLRTLLILCLVLAHFIIRKLVDIKI